MSAIPKRGIKRKRGSDEPTDDSSKLYKKPSLPVDEKFRRKLYHGVKEVKKAAKIAKTRELQRLVKRLKELRAKDDQADAVSVVEEQLKGLKTVDHELIAIEMLLRRLQKDRHIQSNEQAKAAVSAGLESPLLSNAEPNKTTLGPLESRLSSSKALAGPVGDLVTALRRLILPQKIEDTKPHLEATDIVGGSNDVDDGWESDSVQADDQMDEETDDVNHRTTKSNNAPFTSLAIKKKALKPRTKTDSEEDDAPAKRASSKTKVTSDADIDPGYSEFLPSLAVGYTRGDSSASDWSGGDGSDDEKINPSPRKNRRGQRARKACVDIPLWLRPTLTSHGTRSIWEKKYGRNANHVKKEREEEADARKKRAEKMKNPAGKRFRRAGGQVPVDLENRPKDSGWKKNTEDQLGAGGKKEASIHPSWDAAKRKKATPMIVPSTGKKIVF